MDYRINPNTRTNNATQPLRVSQPLTKTAFKGSSLPDNEMNYPDFYPTNARATFFQSFKNVINQLKEIYPLLDPWNSYRAVVEETKMSRIPVNSQKKVNYVA